LRVVDEALLDLMKKYDFHEVDTIRGRLMGEKKEANSEVRAARKALLDALEHAVGVNTACIVEIRSLKPEFEANGQTVLKLASEKAEEYRKKSQHIRETMRRIASKQEEVKHQRCVVQQERKKDADSYTKDVSAWRNDIKSDCERVQAILAGIEAKEQRIRDATHADRKSAWKAQVLIATLDENKRVLDSCNAEICDAPVILDRCGQVASGMGATAQQLNSELCGNVHKDVARRESGGRDLDVRHMEEHVVARKRVFHEKLQVSCRCCCRAPWVLWLLLLLLLPLCLAKPVPLCVAFVSLCVADRYQDVQVRAENERSQCRDG
jgi:chromosome segregation ATPase